MAPKRPAEVTSSSGITYTKVFYFTTEEDKARPSNGKAFYVANLSDIDLETECFIQKELTLEKRQRRVKIGVWPKHCDKEVQIFCKIQKCEYHKTCSVHLFHVKDLLVVKCTVLV